MTDSYFDIDNRHSVYLGRLATHLINEYPNKNLSLSYKLARSILNNAGDITSITKLNKVTAAVATALKIPTNKMWDDLTIELEEMAVNEAAFSAKTLNDINDVAMVTPAATKVVSTVNSTLMTLTSGNTVNSGVWAEYTKANTDNLVKVYNAQIKAGYSNSETLAQITKRLRTVTDGILRNNAEALARTGVSHYANQAKESLINANRDIVQNKYYNTVFDSRRTLICSHFAQNPVYKVDDSNAPNPPMHYGCRSNWLMLVGSQRHPFGDRPAIGSVDGKEAEERYYRRKNALDKRRANPDIDGTTSSQVKYRGKKDSDTFNAGTISGAMTPDSWLREQADWFQNETLGKKRAELFRGGLKIDKFTNMLGRPLTLAQLKASGI